jgi:exodeoxyribonuclease V alpha subunit
MKPQPEPSTQEVLAGLVERVTYHNAENGLRSTREGARASRRDHCRPCRTIAAGEDHRTGEWINDRTHGQQFKARFLRTSLPIWPMALRNTSHPEGSVALARYTPRS